MAHLGVAEIWLLGYPNLGLAAVAAATEPFTGDPSQLHRTYAADGDRCDGDLRFRVSARHSPLTAEALAADVDALVALAAPSDVYTHVGFDGHPDHAEVARQVDRALERSGRAVTRHGTLIHPEGTAHCMATSALQWPNPAETAAGPLARLTPKLDVEPPAVPACGETATGTSWGPEGAPDELVPVGDADRKWRVIQTYASQIDCQPDAQGRIHASCGYMRAFVKAHEFFWTRRFAGGSSGGGPVLVVAAHPDDEALGAAGVIARAVADGRRVVVAVATNGDLPLR